MHGASGALSGASGALSGASGALSGVELFANPIHLPRDLPYTGNLDIIKASIVHSLRWIRHKIRYAFGNATNVEYSKN